MNLSITNTISQVCFILKYNMATPAWISSTPISLNLLCILESLHLLEQDMYAINMHIIYKEIHLNKVV